MDAKEIEDVERASQCCAKCLEWEQRFTELKSEFERGMSGKKLEFSKTVDEQKLNPVVNGSQKTEDSVDIAGDAEDNRILELMSENRVLECEKKRAESDVQVWKSKCEELERRVMELEQGMAVIARVCSSNGMTGIGREETTAATPVGDKSASDEDGSDSEFESLDGFIVDDSDTSVVGLLYGSSLDTSFSAARGWECDGVLVSDLGDDSDSDTDYGNVIARIGRYNDHKWDWKFLADMQAAFGKDPELCMRAICALYRRQTTVEKYHEATILRNRQGFSQCDAFGGSKLGEFLTDGDPGGDLNKSVEELEKYDPRGVDKCRKLALHYSDQLFKSYQSGEDPLWLPSESKRRVIKPDDDKVKLPSGDRCSTQPSGMSEPSAVTPPDSIYERPLVEGKNGIVVYCHRARARKRLVDKEETSARQAVEVNDELGHASELIMTNVPGTKHSSEDLTGSPDPNDEDGVTCQNVLAPSSVRKRKRASTVFNSDSESEDNIPISRLKKESKMDASSLGDEDGKPHVRKRRLMRLINSNKGLSKENSPSPIKCEKTEHPTDKDDESETGGESLDDFIDDDSDVSSKDDPSHTDDESGRESDVNIHYGDIIAKLGRQDDRKWKWEFQADMQADFGKTPELLLRAVCALYRRQTWEEKELKETMDYNGVGFSQFLAFRGSKLGEFLTDGNPGGDLNKSVKELEEFDPWGIATCDKLAFHYAGQLFRLYQSGEDPLWLPSEYRL